MSRCRRRTSDFVASVAPMSRSRASITARALSGGTSTLTSASYSENWKLMTGREDVRRNFVNLVDEFSVTTQRRHPAARAGELRPLRWAAMVAGPEKPMPSATLAWRRLPARRRSAAADTRVVEAILELLTTVPSTDRHQEKPPGNVAR